ncbi:MAG: response regulator [bacterium]|nr:response regulator [bacterium]
MTYTIAIIEDEDILREVLAKKFEQAGFTVLQAADGQAGLKLIQSHKLDLILLDIVMPKMNGYDVLKQLPVDPSAPPVLIIANSGQPVEIDRAMNLGARSYLVKAQTTPDQIVEKVKGVLHIPVLVKQANTSKSIPAALKDANGARILLIEDDQFLRELMVTKLRREGFSVSAAVDGREGASMIQTERPQLVLLDVILPGLDGFSVLQQTRASSDPKVAAIPIVLLSNLGQDSDVQKGRQLGANDYLIKANLTIDEIIKKIRKYIPES